MALHSTLQSQPLCRPLFHLHRLLRSSNTAPIRQHSSVQSANLIYQVKPAYPPIARQTRTQGVVVLEAVIDRDGSIQSLRVVSGHPLLTQAALDAVKQWKYRPTLLNGEPIEVITTVTVTFTLQ